MLPIGAAMMLGFIFFTIHFLRFRNPVQIAILCAVPAIGISVNYIVTRRARMRLQAFSALATRTATPDFHTPGAGTLARGGPSGDALDGGAIAPSAQDQALLKTSRPREIRMAKRGKIGFTAAALGVALFAMVPGAHLYSVWVRTQSFTAFQTKDWVVAAAFILLLLLPVGMWRSQVRECDLLENGEVALGKIVRRWTDPRNNPSVEYEFSDTQGQTHQGSSLDYSRKLYEGMSVPVFYDRDNPKRQIAYCATMHEIVI